MTALERIKEIDTKYAWDLGPECIRDLDFYRKSFKVMREIAINCNHEFLLSYKIGDENKIFEEAKKEIEIMFEEKMK